MSTLHVYCGTYRCIEDGRIVHGPLVRYEGGNGKEQEMEQKERGDAGLVERMLRANYYPLGELGCFSNGQIAGMERALRVAADALLGPVTFNEIGAVDSDQSHSAWANALLAARRARLEATAKTAEDNAVELVEMMMAGGHSATSIVSAVIATLKQTETRQ